MKRTNQLIMTSAICLLYIVTGYASLNKGLNKTKEPSELTKLRKEYYEKIAPINKRYAVLLKGMENSFLKRGNSLKALAVQMEIERFESNPGHLLAHDEAAIKADYKAVIMAEHMEAYWKQFEGKYENHTRDGTDRKNKYHYSEITRSGSESLKWTNRNGNEWILTPTKNPLIYNIGKDCPYYKTGEIAVTFKLKNRAIVGLTFRRDAAYYDKQKMWSD